MQAVVVKASQIDSRIGPLAVAATHSMIRDSLVAAVAGIGVARVSRCVHEQSNHRVAGEEFGELTAEPPTQQRERSRAVKRWASWWLGAEVHRRALGAEALGLELLARCSPALRALLSVYCFVTCG